MSEKLASELISAANGEGVQLRKKMIRIVWQKQIKHLRILDKRVLS